MYNRKMRVALLLNGFIRNLKNLDVINKFLELNKDYDIDIYTHTYNVIGIPSKLDPKSKSVYVKTDEVTEELLRSKLPFKKIFIEDVNVADKQCSLFAADNSRLHVQNRKDNEFLISNIFSQWRNLYKTYSLIDNPSEYDLIIRYRYDLNGEKLNLSEYSNPESNHVYLRKKNKKLLYRNGLLGPLCFDGCVIGSAEAMETVCSIGTNKNYGDLMNDKDNFLKKKGDDYFVTGKKPSYFSNESNLIFWCIKNNLVVKPIKEQHLPGTTLTRPVEKKRV